MKKSLNGGAECATLLTDDAYLSFNECLSKPYARNLAKIGSSGRQSKDCLPDDPTLAKLHAYGFDRHSLKDIHSSFSEGYQRVKINNSYSDFHLI